MDSQNFKLGYSDQEEIPFKWILYNKNFKEQHKFQFMEDVDSILSDVMNVRTGVEHGADVDLRELPELDSILCQIKRRSKRVYRPKILEFCCARENIIIPERHMILPKDLALILKCAPPGGSQVPCNVEDKLLDDEFRSKSRSKCGEIGVKVICSFLIQIIHEIIPSSFWGCIHNFHMMKKAIKRVVCMGIKDRLFVGDVMQRVKIKSFKWAQPLGSHFLMSYVVGKFFIWIIKRVILASLQRFFYITESKSRRNQMLFFRKSSWQKLHNKAIGDLINSGSLKKITTANKNKLSDRQKIAIYGKQVQQLRFLPKSGGVRPICIGGHSVIGYSEEEIKRTKELLKHFSATYKSVSLNVSTSCAFENAWENYIKKISNSNTEKLYIVKLDVKDAYGSILHEKLKQIITRCMIKFLDSGLNTNLSDFDKCSVESLVNKLKGMISAQIVSAGKRTKLLLTKGVPQGGCLSAALCSLYYSAICEQYLTQFIDTKSILLQSVDDFLYVSASNDRANMFLDFMKGGIPEYNCYINEEKMCNTFESAARITFCGIVLCSLTGQLLVDATALIVCPPRYTFSIMSYKHPGKVLARRMIRMTLARLESRVLNPIINKECGLFANVWRVGCVSGVRFLTLIETLKPRGHSNVKHFASIIFKTSHKVSKRVMRVWVGKGALPEFPSVFVRAVFVGGFCAAFKLRHVPLWPALYFILKGHLKQLLEDIPEEYQAKLPYSNVFQ